MKYVRNYFKKSFKIHIIIQIFLGTLKSFDKVKKKNYWFELERYEIFLFKLIYNGKFLTKYI